MQGILKNSSIKEHAYSVFSFFNDAQLSSFFFDTYTVATSCNLAIYGTLSNPAIIIPFFNNGKLNINDQNVEENIFNDTNYDNTIPENNVVPENNVPKQYGSVEASTSGIIAAILDLLITFFTAWQSVDDEPIVEPTIEPTDNDTSNEEVFDDFKTEEQENKETIFSKFKRKSKKSKK